MIEREFSGNPKLYRRISIVLTAGITVWLYGGLAAIQYFTHGLTWIFGWKPIALTVVSGVLLSRYSYRWMMRLDGQFGSGSGWRLERHTVKLPERRMPQRDDRRGEA